MRLRNAFGTPAGCPWNARCDHQGSFSKCPSAFLFTDSDQESKSFSPSPGLQEITCFGVDVPDLATDVYDPKDSVFLVCISIYVHFLPQQLIQIEIFVSGNYFQEPACVPYKCTARPQEGGGKGKMIYRKPL